jgi:hypothetical protein
MKKMNARASTNRIGGRILGGMRGEVTSIFERALFV